jgi:hypothetical protein
VPAFDFRTTVTGVGAAVGGALTTSHNGGSGTERAALIRILSRPFDRTLRSIAR